MKMQLTKTEGRVVTCKSSEKECMYCKEKEGLLFSSGFKKFVCENCMWFVKMDTENEFMKIDKWVIKK